jgi:hypothetical protein
MERPPRLAAATPDSPILAEQKVGRNVAHFGQQSRPATPRRHRHSQTSASPRKPNPHNHFPPTRNPEPATRSPFPPLPPLRSTRTQSHAFNPHTSRLASFRPEQISGAQRNGIEPGGRLAKESPGRKAGETIASRSETMEHSPAAPRVRLRQPHCPSHHHCRSTRPPPPRQRAESVDRNQQARTDSIPPPDSLRSPRRHTLPHRIYGQDQHETVASSNLKVRT